MLGSGLGDSSPVGVKIGCPNPPGLDVETPLWKQDPESQTLNPDDPTNHMKPTLRLCGASSALLRRQCGSVEARVKAGRLRLELSEMPST